MFDLVVAQEWVPNNGVIIGNSRCTTSGVVGSNCCPIMELADADDRLGDVGVDGWKLSVRRRTKLQWLRTEYSNRAVHCVLVSS